MVEIRVEAEPPHFRQCYFCWTVLEVPALVPAAVYEFGLFSGAVCDTCLAMSDSELRQMMAGRVESMREVLDAYRAAANGPILRPRPDLLEAERAVRLGIGVAN